MEKVQVCTRCILDTTVPDIQFDGVGICNYCKQYDKAVRQYVHYDATGEANFEKLIEKINREGKNREYDSIIGVSGGVDSTYVAYLVKKRFGLRPLAVHLDNGWDSELAVKNIEQTLKKLDIDLYTYVLDWEEFKNLQVSFLKSSIANAEIPTDHAITALLYRVAASKGIKYIIIGQNIVTEAIMPSAWMYGSTDLRLIRSVHKKFGSVKLKRYPTLSTIQLAYYTLVRHIRYVRILDYVPYIKSEAKEIVINELGWKDYGGKHYESIYTRFFQSFYLINKFNMDKRKPHLSNLVLSGQMSRENALQEIMKPPDSPERIEEDVEYVIKKLGLTEKEFAEIMATPAKSVSDYPNSAFIRRDLNFFINLARRFHYGEGD